MLLVADPPREGVTREPPAMRPEALVALGRAVFAQGGRVVVPADDYVAPLLATVALAYVGDPVAERRGKASAPPPLVVAESNEHEHPARRWLAPLSFRGAIAYRDVSGARVDLRGAFPGPQDLPEDPELRAEVQDRNAWQNQERSQRDRVTPYFLSRLESVTAVVIFGASEGTTQELMLLADLRRPTFVFSPEGIESAVLARVDARNPIEEFEFSRETRWGAPPDDSSPGAVPYPFVMQRLVADLIGRDG